jgi:hypothetical protein
MLVERRMGAGKDTIGIMRLRTEKNITVKGGAKNGSPPSVWAFR